MCAGSFVRCGTSKQIEEEKNRKEKVLKNTMELSVISFIAAGDARKVGNYVLLEKVVLWKIWREKQTHLITKYEIFIG